MKPLLLTALVLLPFAASSADPPSRSGGIFGFGFSKEKKDQISADLFPAEIQAGTTPTPVASPVTTPSDESIFRGGAPQKVEPVSYAIENGRKVEKEVEKKKSSIFSFGKRDESATAGNQVLAPVPATTMQAPIAASPVPAPPIVAVPNPAPAATPPVNTPTPVAAPLNPAPVEESKESRFAWIPFLSKKKAEPSTSADVPAFSAPATAPVATEIAQAPASPTTPPQSTTIVTEAAKPASPTEAPGSTSFEVPKKTESEPEKSKNEGSGILAPIAKIIPPPKPIDLTNAETIIQNGEIVAPSQPSVDSTTSVSPSAPAERRPPSVVNGVKTYSSWDDVESKSTSAADRIINQIR